MKQEQEWEEQRLMDYLRMGLKEKITKETVFSFPPVKNWSLFIRLANTHGVLSLLYPVIKQIEPPASVLAEVKKQTHRTIQQNYRLLYLTNYLVKKLEKEGVACIVLKGVSTASFYPVSELRKSGDIDLFLGEGNHYEKACLLLKEWGLQKKEKQTSNHHMVFESKEGIEIELHSMLVEPFGENQANEYVRKIGKELFTQVEYQQILGSELPILKDGYHGFYLLLHMLQHFLLAGFGLKLLCDWVIILRKNWEEEERVKLLQLLNDMGLTQFASTMTNLCIEYLGLEKEKVEFLLCKNNEKEELEGLLKEIMKSGEFGKSEKDRLVNLQEASIWGLIKEFHHQMQIKYKKLGNIIIFWPVLWIFTLIEFVYNNWKVRKVSILSVVKKSYNRSKLVKSMNLFKKEE